MKILISDFDKTFYTENYDNNIKLINEFVNAGNKFVIATGRPLYFLEPSIEGKNINYYKGHFIYILSLFFLYFNYLKLAILQI